MTRLVYEYRDFVKSRMKSMGTLQEDLLHMTLGIAGESGELVDAVKKYWVYGKPLNVNNVIEELGDLLFYIQGMLSTVTRQGALSPETLEDLMITNMDKHPSDIQQDILMKQQLHELIKKNQHLQIAKGSVL